MAELSFGKDFETRGKDWFSLQVRREAGGFGKPCGEPSQWQWAACGWCGGEPKGTGGGVDRVGHWRSTLHWT